MIHETREKLLAVARRWVQYMPPRHDLSVELDGAVHDFLGAIEDELGVLPAMPDQPTGTTRANGVVLEAWRWLKARTTPGEEIAAMRLRAAVSHYTAGSEIEIKPHILRRRPN